MKSNRTHTTMAYLLGWLCVAGLTVMLLWQADRRPLVADEIEFVQTCPAIWQGRPPAACNGSDQEVILHHPQGYHLLLGMTMELFGDSNLAARAPGIVSLLVCLPLIYWLAQGLHRKTDQRLGWFAGVLLLTSPMVIQGSLLVDIDNTVLMPSLLAFVCLLTRRLQRLEKSQSGMAIVGLSAVFALLLWIKLPTPFLITGSFFVYGILAKSRRLVMEAMLITLLGGLVFFLTWYLFCHLKSLDPLSPILHLAASFGRSGEAAGIRLAKNGLRLIVWLGPWLPLAAAGAVGQMVARPSGIKPDQAFVALCTAAFLIVYVFIGGNAFGFPRYHVPVVPFLACLAAGWIQPLRQRPAMTAWIAGLAFVYWVFIVGDPLLPLYTLNESVAAGDIEFNAAVSQVIVSMLLWVLPGVIIAGLPRFRPGLGGIALLAPVCGSALLVLQFMANYNTHYLYGEKGLSRAIDQLAGLTPVEGTVLAPKDVAYQARLACGTYVFATRTIGQGKLEAFLEQDKLSIIAIRKGLLTDASTAPHLSDPVTKNHLANAADAIRIGDFFFYILNRKQHATQNTAHP